MSGVGVVLGNPVSKSVDQVLTMRLHHDLATGSSTEQQEVREFTLKARMQVQLRLLDQDKRAGFRQQTQHQYGEHLANADANCSQIYILSSTDGTHLQADTQAREILRARALSESEPLQPRVECFTKRPPFGPAFWERHQHFGVAF